MEAEDNNGEVEPISEADTYEVLEFEVPVAEATAEAAAAATFFLIFEPSKLDCDESEEMADAAALEFTDDVASSTQDCAALS